MDLLLGGKSYPSAQKEVIVRTQIRVQEGKIQSKILDSLVQRKLKILK